MRWRVFDIALAATEIEAGKRAARRGLAVGVLVVTLISSGAVEAARLSIPPQDLAGALDALGHQTGVRILYGPELVRGARTSGLEGEMSLEEALHTLTDGTGFTFRIDGDVVVILARSTGDVVTLPEMSVPGLLENIYGHVDGFVATRTATGSKTDTPLIELPLSISVVTRDQLVARHVQTDSEALLYTPGVFAQPFGGSLNQFNNFYRIRGFATAFGGSYVDGLASPVNYRDEPYGVERYEILRGPNSVLYGQSDPGGLINRTTKRPPAERFGEVMAEYGTYRHKQFGLDVGGPVDEGDTLRYRLTFMARDADAAVDYASGQTLSDHRYYVAPALTWNASRNTSVTLLGSFLLDDAGQAMSYVTPDYRVTRIRLDQPGAHDFDYSQYFVGYAFDHRFDERFAFRQRFRYAHMDFDYVSLAQASINPPSINGTLVDRYAFGFDETRHDILLDNQLQTTLTTGPVQHAVLFGVDYQNLDDDVAFSSDFVTVPPLDIVNPDYGRITPALSLDQHTTSKTENVGIYLQDQMKIVNQWIVTLGLRNDWANSRTKGFAYGEAVDESQSDRALTYRAGVTYLADNGLAPYFSYAEGFLPTGGLDANGEPFEPTTSRQYELGLKYQPRGFKGLFTVALFDLTKQNVVTLDRFSLLAVQTGEIRSRGIELEATAHLTERLALQAAYAYTDAEVTRSGTGNQGEQPALTPRHMASVWLDYRWTDGLLAGSSLGGGVRYIGSTYAWDTDSTLGPDRPREKNSAYTLVDLAIRYDLGQVLSRLRGVTVAVNATNLLDHRYQICYSRFDCQAGVPRTVIGSLSYRW